MLLLLLLLLLLGILSQFAAGLIYAQSSVVKIESIYFCIHGSRNVFIVEVNSFQYNWSGSLNIGGDVFNILRYNLG